MSQPPHAPSPQTSAQAVSVMPAATSRPDLVLSRTPLVMRLLGVLQREPVLFLSLGYVLISALGLWSSYWFYRRFGIPILEYLQISDVFFAALKRPDYLALLVLAIILMWLSTWPQRIHERDPARAARIRSRWWGVWLFPAPDSWMTFWGMRSESLLVLGSASLGLYMLFVINSRDAQAIYDGRSGARVVVRMLGQDAALPEARLLGTSSDYVYLWWPEAKRSEVLPVTSIARIALQPVAPAQARAVRRDAVQAGTHAR